MQDDPIAEKLLAAAPKEYPSDFKYIAPARVIRSFGVDDYQHLADEKQVAVDEWLKKYDLVTHQAAATDVYAVSNHPEWKLEVWGWVHHRHYVSAHSKGYQNLPLGYDRDGNPTLTLIATFEFDDFPWDVLDD